MTKVSKRTLAAMLIGLAGAPANAQAISDNVVKIGILEDMSGSSSTLGGRGNVIAAEMAIADFGSKVLGKPIELVFADHQNKTDVSSSVAREWFDTGHVDLITGLAHSASALAVQQLGAEKKRLVIVTSAGTSELTGKSCTPYSIHYSWDTYSLARSEGTAIVEAGGKKWFFITNDGAFGKSMQANTTSFITKGGGKVLGTALHPTGAPDFTSYLLQAQTSGADVIGLANSGEELINSIKQAGEFGIGPNGQRLAALVVFDPDIKALGLAAAQGIQFVSAFYWDRDDATRAWSRRFFEKHGAMPTMIHAGTYSAVTNYLKAVRDAGTDDADTVMAKLRSMDIRDFFAVNGRIRPDGRMVHDMYLMEVKKPSESKEDWDLMRIVAVIPAEDAFLPLSESACALARQ